MTSKGFSYKHERIVLGQLMIDRTFWNKYSEALQAVNFESVDHKKIYAVIESLYKHNRSADALSVSDKSKYEIHGPELSYLVSIVEAARSPEVAKEALGNLLTVPA